MAKIHTHYDNLKVARLAPPEVIRAAYKALSQKYHPDKNPGDEKAARIMAILNSAYNTLSDAQRRKEHDEWIAAEEWEIEWLESTRNEDSRVRGEAAGSSWAPEVVDTPRRRGRAARVLGMLACFALGCGTGVFLMTELSASPPVALASLLAPHSDSAVAAPVKTQARGAKDDLPADNWASAKPAVLGATVGRGAKVHALVVTELIIPAIVPECADQPHVLVAPNGEAWPTQSAYLEGFPIGNNGDDTRLNIDNGANASGVFVKVFDLDQRISVRHLFVLAHDKFTVDKLAAGRYELRYQNLDLAAGRADCADSTKPKSE